MLSDLLTMNLLVPNVIAFGQAWYTHLCTTSAEHWHHIAYMAGYQYRDIQFVRPRQRRGFHGVF